MQKNILLGFSTGFFYKFGQPMSREAILLCKKLGCQAIELCGVLPERINLLKNIKKNDLHKFKYISLHSSGLMKYKNNNKTKSMLDIIQEAHDKLNFNCVIIHPDLIEDWAVFKNYTFPLAVENMDRLKKSGKTPRSFKKILANKKIKLVLDLNHCYTIDKSMKLAEKFYHNFKKQICEIHLSGYKNKNELHVPLFKTKQNIILRAVKNDLPIIIESTCENIIEAQKEYNYIKNYLIKNECSKF
ncbi:MAG: hypothetical protein ABIG60_04565 [Patescibacteria group bacterium]